MRKKQRGMVLFFNYWIISSAVSLLGSKIFTMGEILQLSADHLARWLLCKLWEHRTSFLSPRPHLSPPPPTGVLFPLMSSLEEKRNLWTFLLKGHFSYFFLLSTTANVSLRYSLLEQQRNVQPWRREDWVWHTGDQTSLLLEHILLQDLPRYEDRPADQVYCHQQAGELLVLSDRWWAIPQHLTGSWHMEVADWFWGLLTAQLWQGRFQCCL